MKRKFLSLLILAAFLPFAVTSCNETDEPQDEKEEEKENTDPKEEEKEDGGEEDCVAGPAQGGEVGKEVEKAVHQGMDEAVDALEDGKAAEDNGEEAHGHGGGGKDSRGWRSDDGGGIPGAVADDVDRSAQEQDGQRGAQKGCQVADVLVQKGP